MGVLSMVLGPSGSGKSTSLRNFQPGCAMVFGCTGKRLPFRSSMPVILRANYATICAALAENVARVYVIDDSTYLMQLDNFHRAHEKGYDKFVKMAVNFECLLEAAMATTPDTIVYFLHHPQFGEDGGAKPQTIGKMLDSQLCVEGLFDMILECAVVEGRHVFFTNEHGISKTPWGMFSEQIIDNDLAMVDACARSFWGMPQLATAPATYGGQPYEA